MKPITGQSALIFMPEDRKPAHVWQLVCPVGMLHTKFGEEPSTVRKFTSAEAFDGYVSQLRARGYTVHFSTPFVACVEAKQ